MLNLWHAEEREVVLHRLGSDAERGLAPAESTRRLREHGPNVLSAAGPSWRGWRPPDPFTLSPLLAAALCARLGEWAAAVAALGAAVACACCGSWRERPLRRGEGALARLSAPAARVVRGGRAFLIPAAELVPGDLAQVAAGDRVPADLRLFDARRLVVDESSLTGVPFPVGKDAGRVLPEKTALADRANMLFAGTLVTGGEGAGIVIATGMRSELGRIAALLAAATPSPPPLRRRIGELGQALGLALLAGVAAIAAVLWLRGGPPAALLAGAAGLALAAVPAGVPAAVAAALAGGARRLRRLGALPRTPATAEALGGVEVVVTDATGTLTRGELTVTELVVEDEALQVTGRGIAPEGGVLGAGGVADPARWESLEIALRIGALCSAATLLQDGDGKWRVEGSPVDGALLTLAAKGGLWRDELLRGHPQLALFPFTAERRQMTVVVAGRAGRPTAYTKGAPDVVLAHCLHHRTAAGVRPLAPADRERILRRAERMGAEGLRVLGLAYREDADGAEPRAVERALVWVGLAGMLDPPREGAAAAVAACRASGIATVIVTGERPETALALAREIGALRPGDEAISGEELEQSTPEAVGACIERYRVCARANAEHKLRIVRAWKRRGRRVAMIGEGVIDAPALREADVGVCLGRGVSGVARDEAALEMPGGDLESLAAAVLSGRGTGESVARATAFLLAPAAAATLALLAAAAARLPLPLAPLQLLWLAAVSGLVPALALAAGVAPGEPSPGELRREARERARDREWRLLALAAAAGLALAAAAAALAARHGAAGDATRAAAHAFATLGLSTPLLALGFRDRARALHRGVLREGRWLLAAVAAAGALAVAAAQQPWAAGVPGIAPLDRAEWLRVGALALLPLAAAESCKAWLRARREV